MTTSEHRLVYPPHYLNTRTPPVLEYRYTDVERQYYRARLIEPSDLVQPRFKTEDDVITAWSNAARNALERSNSPESPIKCWEGHYEQFGVVMMSLANIARTGKGWNGRWIEAMAAYAPAWFAEEVLYHGPEGHTENRKYYRAWFTMIGHPHFGRRTILDSEYLRYRAIEAALTVAYGDLEDQLVAQHDNK